ncbi:MAG: T9SS type A sorting domain-containing protein [Bacteroidia bacterium]|nr:T9SS type A sorting domain-containing protein [Bacteroidia bacterium]
MKKVLLVAAMLFAAALNGVQAQEKCISEILFQEEAAKNPALLQSRQALEDWTAEYLQQHPGLGTENVSLVPRVIPVVVHVIHYGGPENISKAQILDQIDSLNKDFSLTNFDTINIPPAFRPLAGNVNVEFRMAQLDPNGNCTDGIVRVYSPLTYNARNNVKALSYWPSNQYLNIWVVNSIANTGGSPGQVIGFAQFPGTGLPTTDGVVIKHDFMGSIGTASNSGNNGRTATHEIGHWMNLRHIWGDATCGNDFVSDTPPQFEANLSICPSFPHLSNCPNNAPNGDMYTNYMDYTNGDCQNMFSAGQAARMDAALSSAVSGRNNLSQPANLVATGTDGSPAVLCAPKADFATRQRFICEGASTQFNDASWGGEATSRLWTFNGGTPATDTSANPVVTYAAPGTYDVTLTKTNAAGTDTKTVTGMVVVSPNTAAGTVPFSEGFEGAAFPTANDWYLLNPNDGSAWEVNNAAAATGQYSINLYNFAGNDKGPDEFITNAFDLSNVTAAVMTFKLAFAFGSATQSNTDKLVVYFSTNCGQSWTPRYTRQGSALQTTTAAVANDFIPSAAQWRTETVNLSPTSISTKPNVRFRFEFTHDTGNNIYIDDINLTGTVGIDEVNADNANVSIYPNPSASTTYVDFNLTIGGAVKIDVTDAQGRMVSTFQDELPAGEHQYTMNHDLAKGLYFVRLTFGDRSVTKKVVLK